MRDLRSLGQRLRALHALSPPPMPRFDPLAAARRYADIIVRSEPEEGGRIQFLLAAAPRRWRVRVRSSARRPSCTATCITATCSPPIASISSTGNTRRSAIRCSTSPASWRTTRARCRMARCCSKPSGLAERGATTAMLARAHQRIHAADISLVPRAPRGPQRARHRPAARIHGSAPPAFAGARRANLGTLAPRICANLQGVGKRNGDVAGD